MNQFNCEPRSWMCQIEISSSLESNAVFISRLSFLVASDPMFLIKRVFLVFPAVTSRILTDHSRSFVTAAQVVYYIFEVWLQVIRSLSGLHGAWSLGISLSLCCSNCSPKILYFRFRNAMRCVQLEAMLATSYLLSVKLSLLFFFASSFSFAKYFQPLSNSSLI